MTTKKIFNLSLTNGRSHEQSILMDGSGGGSNPPTFDKTENYFDQKHRYVENACGTKNIQRVNLRTGKLSVTQYVKRIWKILYNKLKEHWQNRIYFASAPLNSV